MPNNLTRQDGFTLVEVMIALLVMAVGLAGVAGLTLLNVSGTAAAQIYSQATIFGDQMADGIRGNMLAYESSAFISDPAVSSVDCASGTACTAVEMAEYDVTVDGSLMERLTGAEAWSMLDEKTIEQNTDGQFKFQVPCWGVGVFMLGTPKVLQPIKAAQAKLNKKDLSVPDYFVKRPHLNKYEWGTPVPPIDQ